MSKFYGMVCGNRGAATRGGSANSGFKASAQSYDGSIITYLDYDKDNKLLVQVGTNDGSSCCTDWNSHDFRGTFAEFKEMLNLYHDIKTGKCSVVRHRDPDGFKKIAKQKKFLGIE